MAWLRKIPRSPYWHAIIHFSDSRKTTRSAGTTKKRETQRIADQFEEAYNIGQQDKLVEKRARKTIADIFAIANQAALETSSIDQYLQAWLKRK